MDQVLGSGRLRVMFLCATLSGGGAERFVSTSLRVLPRERFAPALAVLRRQLEYPLPDDVPVYSLDKAGGPHGIPLAVLRLARLVDRVRPDVVLGSYAFANEILGEALRLARHRPRFIARIANNVDKVESHLRSPLKRWIAGRWLDRSLRRADVIMPNAQGLAGQLTGRTPEWAGKITVVPNPTDFEYIDRLAAQANPVPRCRDRRRIVAVGRFNPAKRYDRMLQAFAAALRDQAVELVVCGDGPLRPEIEARIRALGLSAQVRLAGFLSNPYPVIASADLFLLTSDYEGLPNALIEAQGLGIPAISTDCPTGPNEIIDPGVTGVLTPLGRDDELVAALRRWHAAPFVAPMPEAAASARSKFGLPKILCRLEDLLAPRAG